MLKLESIKLRRVLLPGAVLEELLQQVPRLREYSLLAISSKVLGILEGRYIRKNEVKSKDKLIKSEADAYLPRSRWGILTRAHSALSLAAGVDEFGEWYVLLPKDPGRSANCIRQIFKKRDRLTSLGVVITDSHTVPLRRGKFGYAVGWAGFTPLRQYRGEKNILGRKMKMTQANLADALAASAVLLMGEGGERTPMAVIKGLPKEAFVKAAKSSGHNTFEVPVREDIFSSLLEGGKWRSVRAKQKPPRRR